MCFDENVRETKQFWIWTMMYKRAKLWTIKKENTDRKILIVFSLFLCEHFIIMTKSWSKSIQKKLFNSEYDYAIHLNAEQLTFLNYDIIPQKRIVDINDHESFANADVFTPSNSSEEETQKWRLIVNQFDLEIKILKKTYVQREHKNQFAKVVNRLEVKSKWVNINVIKWHKLIDRKKLDRLHKNVGNIILHLLNLNPFLTEIKTLIKKMMITINDDWNIQSSVPQTILKKKEKTKK